MLSTVNTAPHSSIDELALRQRGEIAIQLQYALKRSKSAHFRDNALHLCESRQNLILKHGKASSVCFACSSLQLQRGETLAPTRRILRGHGYRSLCFHPTDGDSCPHTLLFKFEYPSRCMSQRPCVSVPVLSPDRWRKLSTNASLLVRMRHI